MREREVGRREAVSREWIRKRRWEEKIMTNI